MQGLSSGIPVCMCPGGDHSGCPFKVKAEGQGCSKSMCVEARETQPEGIALW